MPLSATARFKRRLRALTARVTRNRLTFVFFLFGFFHCFAQGIVQSFQFTLDQQYASFFNLIVTKAGVNSRAHADLRDRGDRFQLRICYDIPHSLPTANCSVVFDMNKDLNMTSGAESNSPLRGMLVERMIWKRNVTFNPTESGVILQMQEEKVNLSNQCINTLLLPLQRIQNARREDVTFVILQFWLFGISMVAMTRDSVPHILAGLGTRIILTAWSAYALWRSPKYHNDFRKLIETSGTPCSVEIFPEYFRLRTQYEIIDSILNFTALLIAAYLSSALLKRYNVESFNYIGAPPKIVRIHRYFMAVKVCLQLEAFVLLAWIGLWTDQVFNNFIKDITLTQDLFKGSAIAWTILLAPWIVTGWYGIRNEHRLATLIFIVFAFVHLACSSVMFYSEVYRWTFVNWPNFGCYVTASLVLLTASFILGILCRMNFGQGLSPYIHAEEALASSDFAPEVFEHDVEKVDLSLTLSDPESKPEANRQSRAFNIPTLPWK
ncbi:hypothetical protein PM082_019276 [Marasmius tenuissimus]|nr:hypothetical protein PM082_019276 [Marasmius tenuissimus]